MVFKRVYILPILIGIIFPVTFLTTYIISTTSDRVYPFFPYISDTGTWAPESCFFGQMVNLGALVMGLIVYVRYLLIIEITNKNVVKNWIKKYNKIASIIGYAAVLGVSIVANFQETNFFIIHIIGALLAFGIGSVYFATQVLISFSLKEYLGNKYVNVFRLTCFIVIMVTMNVGGITGVMSFIQFDGDDITKWNSNYAGYNFHVVSSISEWILVLAVVAFLCSFISEFKHVTIETPKLNYKTN